MCHTMVYMMVYFKLPSLKNTLAWLVCEIQPKYFIKFMKDFLILQISKKNDLLIRILGLCIMNNYKHKPSILENAPLFDIKN